jgi:hypothetical protein
MWLPNVIVKETSNAVKVFYVGYAVTRLWAAEREKGEPLVFSGWYWANGTREGGPFKSQSACYRDAWFNVVRRVAPPVLHADMLRLERQSDRRPSTRKRKAT